MITRCVLLLGIAGLVCTAQEKFEIGGAAGYGLYKNRTITRGSATADAGFRSGLLFGIVAGNDMHRLVGGEVRYTRRDNDLKLSSGGTDATFSGEAHILHYDMLIHAAPRESTPCVRSLPLAEESNTTAARGLNRNFSRFRILPFLRVHPNGCPC